MLIDWDTVGLARPERDLWSLATETGDEFRRYTENDLRARKREDALAVVHALDALTPAGDRGAVLKVTGDEAQRWLGALNDLRLTIGSRLDVDEDPDSELYRLPDDDPRKPLVMAYMWLGGLQESLIETLLPRLALDVNAPPPEKLTLGLA